MLTDASVVLTKLVSSIVSILRPETCDVVSAMLKNFQGTRRRGIRVTYHPSQDSSMVLSIGRRVLVGPFTQGVYPSSPVEVFLYHK